MKDKLTLRNILIWCAGLFGILVFIFSFLAAYRLTQGADWSEARTFIWGARTTVYSDGSSQTVSPENAAKAAPLPIVGAFLVLVGALCAVCMSLFGDKLFKNEKVGKIVLFVAGGFMVLGGVFAFFAQGQFEQLNYVDTSHGAIKSVEEYRKMIADAGFKISCALPVISGILAILGGGAVVASQFIPDKKLGK